MSLDRGVEESERHGMERREFTASGLRVALSISVVNVIDGCNGGSKGGFDMRAG